MQNLKLMILICISVSSCISQPSMKPDDFHKMKEALKAIHIFEAEVNLQPQWTPAEKKHLINLNYGNIYKKLGLNRHEFDSLYVYLLKNPTLHDSVYQIILTELSQEQAKLQNQESFLNSSKK